MIELDNQRHAGHLRDDYLLSRVSKRFGTNYRNAVWQELAEQPTEKLRAMASLAYKLQRERSEAIRARYAVPRQERLS